MVPRGGEHTLRGLTRRPCAFAFQIDQLPDDALAAADQTMSEKEMPPGHGHSQGNRMKTVSAEGWVLKGHDFSHADFRDPKFAGFSRRGMFFDELEPSLRG